MFRSQHESSPTVTVLYLVSLVLHHQSYIQQITFSIEKFLNLLDATALPSLDDIICLKEQTLRHIPSYALPAFACALSAALLRVSHENTLEAWIKLLLLPKCCLPSAKRSGRHHKPIDITMLCDLWSRGQFGVLWRLTQCHSYLLQGKAYIQKHARF